MVEQNLADIEAIKQLKARYFRFLDTKQWDQYRTVFAPDLVLITDHSAPDANGHVESSAPVRGRDVFVDWLSDRLSLCVTVHHGHMPEITLTSPTTATGIWSMEDIVEHPKGKLHAFGHYHETYTKIDGRWHIQTLHLKRLRVDLTGDFRNIPTAKAA